MLDRKKKYYTYAMILYKDSMSYDYDKVIDYITKNWDQYAYIEHEPEKEESKYHTHVLVHFNNKRYISAISKELNIPENYIEPANLIPYLRYLIHLDNEEKIQYSPFEVKGSLQSKLVTIIQNDKMSEPEMISCILDFIFEYPEWLSMSVLSQFVLRNGCYSAFRRNYHFIKDIVAEHNI